MRNGLKKVMALMMTLMMILSLVPATVFADTTSNTVVVNGVAPQADGDGQEAAQDGEEKETCTIVINYVFADGSQAANPWTATIAKGSSYRTDVTSPTLVGYTPDPTVVNVNVTNVQQDVTYTVTYRPAEVNFTVKHYQQNVDNDQYTLVETETRTGFTEAMVGDGLKKTYDGFTALLYDATTKIAADGSTEVEIYYDRNYYLLSLDLKGGYGADPVYARYGAAIAIDDPVKAGYTFGGWDQTKPDTMPAKDMTLTAQWNAGQATYLVQYWLENANDDNYSYDSSVQRSATVGSSVSGSGDKSYTGFKFDHADQNVTVNGDGTTVVNVYYKRISYEVKFYSKSRMYDRDEYTSLRITAKYGAYIGDKWPTYNGSNTWNVGSQTYQSNIQTMPLNGAKFYGPYISQESETAYYYVQVLPGESGTEYNGVIYKEHHHDVSAGSGFTITDEDKYPIDGFTFKEVQAESSRSGKLLYADAKFYYTRNQYELVFDDQYGTKVTERLPFEQVLSESVHYKNNYQPAYPSTLEVGAYVFDGWYTDPGCTKPVDWNAKMPAASVVLYAYWAPVQHTVTFAKNEDEEPEHSENVAHGSTASGYTTTNGNYTFIGWFYKENGVEKAYTTSMQIRKDLELYAKWRSDVMRPYTIYYKLLEEDGTVIATETTGSALAGTTKTFDAKAGDQLYEGYRTGYFPQTNSHSLTMDIDGNNEFTFIYVPREKVKYTVRYLDKATGEPVVVNGVPTPDKNDETSSAVITETFKQITGYTPDAYQKRLVLSANEKENVLIFWYEKDNVHAPVQIIHWTQNIAGDGYTEYQSSTKLDGVIGKPYTENPLTIPGYTYNAAKSNASGTLTADGLVLNLYYDRIEYPYEFRFLEQGTDKVLADPEKGSARYQAQVTQIAKAIPGYTLVSPENQAMNIAIEDPADVASKNVRTFYYAENTVNITYVAVQPAGAGNTLSSYADNNVKVVNGTVEGSTPQPAPTYKFVGWFKDEACTIPVDAAWVDANGKITPQKETLVEGQPAMGYKAAIYYAKFELNAVTVTVRKEVTGNFGDKSKYFKITYGSGENDSIRIKNGEALELPMDVLVNSILNLTEECEGYSASAICKVGNDTIATASVVYAEAATKKNPTLTFNFSDEGKQLTGDAVIIITNHKDTTPDTGVLLDSLPYILIIACVAAIGAFIVIRRRKNRED